MPLCNQKWPTVKRKLRPQLVALFFIAIALIAPRKAISQTITYSSKKVTLQQLFTEVKKQTNYAVIFNPDKVDITATVAINAKNLPLEAFMRAALAKLPLAYTIVGTTIVVFYKTNDTSELDLPLMDVPGVVYDGKTMQGIPGVSIITNTSGAGTQSNEKGEFVLKKVKMGDMISFSSIGYEKQTLSVGPAGSSMTVRMNVATSVLDQAVVQAYGVTSKRLSTGNISKVTGEEIAMQPVMNPLLALQGRVPGMVITPTTGYASSPVKVQIRGRSSINPNVLSEPLYVVDGVPLNILNISGYAVGEYGDVSPGLDQSQTFNPAQGQSPLFTMNPQDIESIEVLKDGGATAIYGSRGANGVILITTKKGKPGETRFDLGASQGATAVTRFWPMLNTQEYLQMRREAFANDGITPTAVNAPDLMVWDTTRYTNWQKEGLKGGKMTNVNATLSGGTGSTSFRLSAGYMRQTDILTYAGSNQRLSTTLNLNHRSKNQKLSLSMTAEYSYIPLDMVLMPQFTTLEPNAPAVFDSRGNLNYADWNAAGMGGSYPFSSLLNPFSSKTNSLNSSLRISYQLLKDLTFITSVGYANSQFNSLFLQTIAGQNPVNTNITGASMSGGTSTNNWIVEPQLSYNRYIGKLKLSVLAGGTMNRTVTEGSSLFGAGFKDDALLRSIYGASFVMAGQNYGQYKYAALFGRVNLNWEDKYVLELTGRRDGSSRFAPGSQFGNFGSVAGTWIASEEKWMKDILPGWFSFVKFRGSYALTGSDNVGDYQYLSQWASYSPVGATLFNYNGIKPLVPLHHENQLYHWQLEKKLEVAAALGFLDNRINLGLSWYRNRRNNQLMSVDVAAFTGFNKVVANWPANVENAGLEADLSARIVSTAKFSWTVNFNISHNVNKLLAYPEFEASPFYSQYKLGESLDMKYLLHYQGVDPQTGQYSYADHNHDGSISANTALSPGTGNDDRYIGINTAPKFTGGIGNSLNYKNWMLYFFFDFKNQMGLSNLVVNGTPGGMNNISPEVYNNRWRHPGDNARYARLSTTSTISDINFNNSDAKYSDASFLRCNNVSLGYVLPEKLLKKASVKGASVRMSMQNFFVLTVFKGMDPDMQTFGTLPPAKALTCSLYFNF
ncbi:MAG: SusC/RagA family TonB-linked outer membrane protein [Chitinophaga sp.]|uniref:SusC/RagA family TonB-linked outer membrane protein n=1 Tax=Chitinophaga sp. TaxID=1869181 RepID=UPI001B17909D|nr:SusC/RagA family TonB-linked outer membrane protein [Chitinophaga sp.]MBO9728518.1 SusC/RagA family TonB-linked outer membrane protein [Chitinophaga sp.]